jgi:hypothetical protein
MAQRKAHGAAAKNGTLVVHEPLPFDEHRRPDPQPEQTRPVTRRADGTVADSEVAGQDFADAYVASLARMFDGTCGEGPASIVKTAGMQLAVSRYFYDRGKLTGDAKMLGQASQLGNDSRVSAGSAYELQSREAEARAKRSPRNAHDLAFGPETP